MSLLLDTVIFASHLEGKDQIVSCKLSFASGLFSYERGSLGWIHYIGIIGLTEFCV